MVRQELLQIQDELSSWVQEELHDDFFLPEDIAIQKKYSELVSYVYSLTKFNQAQKDAFLNGADGWLIAAASCTDSIIITHEHYDSKCQKKYFYQILPSILTSNVYGLNRFSEAAEHNSIKI